MLRCVACHARAVARSLLVLTRLGRCSFCSAVRGARHAFPTSSAMPKRRAVTLDDLSGAAHERVSFLRTDARAAVGTKVSRTKQKEAFVSDLEPHWVPASGEASASILRQLGDEHDAGSVSTSDSGAVVCLGRNAVTRALRQRSLRTVILARDSGPQLLYAHLAPLAQQGDVSVCVLACTSARLGQPFGLLRCSALGLRRDAFNESHALVQLVKRAASPALLLPWLDAAVRAREPSETPRAEVDESSKCEDAAQKSEPTSHESSAMD